MHSERLLHWNTFISPSILCAIVIYVTSIYIIDLMIHCFYIWSFIILSVKN